MNFLINTLITIFIHGAIAVGPFAALLLLNKKYKNPYLVSIILCLSVIVSHSYFISGAIGHFIKSPFIIAEPFIFLISPLLYLYFLHITNNRLAYSWQDLKHAIPFFFFFASFIPISLHGSNTVYYQFLFSNKIVMTGVLWVILTLQFLYYYSRIYKLNKSYISKLVAQHSNYQQYEITWVRMFLLLFLAILAFVSIVLFVFLHNSKFQHFSTVVAAFFSLQVYFVAYKGLNQETTVVENEIGSIDTSGNKEYKGTERQDVYSENKEKLKNYVLSQKPYLNADLTLSELAVEINMTRNELSALINNEIGSNFYLYINEFRVSHVKELIKQDVSKQFTILALAYESGFNSKSTFNAIFKKLTGLTPTEFRKTIS